MHNTVAVTGHNGYIGSVLSRMLYEEGYEVFGFDRHNIDHKDPYWISGSSNDIEDFVNVVMTKNVNKIFHLAAKSVPISESMTHPMRYYANNVGVTSMMLNHLVEFGWKGNIVFASSASVYDHVNEPVAEDSRIVPMSHYGISKLMCEQILSAAQLNDIRTIALRFFNVAGAYGVTGDKNAHVLSELCKAAKDRTIFNLNGTKHATRDGTCVRDYVHVIDVCRAMIVAMRDMEIARDIIVPKVIDRKFDVYNLGTYKGTSILELIGMVKQISGRSINYRVLPARAGDPPTLVANPGKFITDYGFQYKHSDIETIVKTAWEYHNGV